jgi:hypothetical protein
MLSNVDDSSSIPTGRPAVTGLKGSDPVGVEGKSGAVTHIDVDFPGDMHACVPAV